MLDAPGRIATDTTRLSQPQHVWVDISGRWDGEHQMPGLLVMWRRYDRGGRGNHVWQAWVVRVDLPRDGEEPTMTHSWVDASHVRPLQHDTSSRATSGNGESRPTPA